MFKCALLRLCLGLGLSTALASGAIAAPRGKARQAASKPATSGEHDHLGETSSIRDVRWTSEYRAGELADGLKKAFSGKSDDRPSSRPSDERGGGSSSSSYYGGYAREPMGKSYFPSFSSSDSKIKSAPKRAIPLKTVKTGDATGLSKAPIRPAVFGGSSGASLAEERQLKKLGTLIAEGKLPLLSGGGNGIPQVAQEAAYKAGGHTVGFAQASSESDHHAGGRPSDHLTVLYATGTGHGPGTIEREAALVEQTNIGFVAGGSIGTLGELVQSLYKPGVLAFFRGFGGVGDAAMKKIIPHLGPLPAHVALVEDADHEQLVIKSMHALAKMPSALAFPASTVRLGKREVFSKPETLRDNVNIISYLVDRQGMSAADLKSLKRLTTMLHEGPIAGRAPVVVVPDRGGLTEQIAKEAAAAKVQTFAISHLGPAGVEKLPDSRTRVSVDKGAGVGEAASDREVVQNARVVVVAGGDYKTMNGIIYALHHDTLVAVLESGGLSGKLRTEIMPVISDKSTKGRIVYASTPEALYAKIKLELDPPPPPPKPKYVPSSERKGDDSEHRGHGKSFGFGFDDDYDRPSWE